MICLLWELNFKRLKTEINNRKEQWAYIFKVFPIIDIPFNILAIVLSENWIATLVLACIFPISATIILKLSEKKNFQPGYYILGTNGVLFCIYMYVSGKYSPTWLGLINVTVGSSFMFNNPRVGQIMSIGMGIFAGIIFYIMGSSIEYSVIIATINIAFVVLFSRAHSYMQLQQRRIEDKSKELESKNKDITDSINYAKRIQYAVLPHEETIYRSIPLSFIYYKPKDIVSGDFFWFHEINKDEYILVCADCTGHGVPGAFMTVIGSSLLNQTVIDNKITEPGRILSELDKLVSFTLKQQKDYDISVQDGMDLSLIKVNKTKKEFIITGAKRPVAFIRDKQLQDLKGSKFSIGGMRTDEKRFDEIKISYKEDDMLYFYTDGYTDQFGGEKGKKFSSKRLKENFLSIHRLSVAEQKQNLNSTMNKWMNELEQVDDMLIIGIKL